MTLAVYAFETRTGKVIAPLDASVRSWRRELNGTDISTIIVAPGAVTVATKDWIRLITTPWRMSIAIAWDGILIWAGPVVGRKWERTGLTVSASGVRALFSRRKVVRLLAAHQATQNRTFTNFTLDGIAASMVSGAIASSPGYDGAGRPLPIITPAALAGANTRIYYGFDGKDIDSALADLTGVIGGPDIDFQPSWVDSSQAYVQWTMRTGTAATPGLTSPNALSWDASQPGSPVSDLSYNEDATLLATRDWAHGSGSDVDTLISTAADPSLIAAGYPLLESETDYTTVVDQATLDAHAQGDLAAQSTTNIAWTLSVAANQQPTLGTYLLGDTAFVRVADHPWIPDSPDEGYSMRIVAMSGDQSPTVKLDVQ